MGQVAAEGKVHGDSPAHALWKRLAPSRFLRREIEHSQISRLLHQQIAPELVGIFLRERREFVNEALCRERGVRVSHGAQPLHGNVDVHLVRFDGEIWDRVGKIVNAFDGCRIVLLSLHHHGFERVCLP